MKKVSKPESPTHYLGGIRNEFLKVSGNTFLFRFSKDMKYGNT